MNLESAEVRELVNLIRDSFRVRANHKPIYVEIGDSFRRLSSAQHQVIYGRRGSGKSCLLVHFQDVSKNGPTKVVYVGIDAIKKLPFPDILTRLLISIFEQLPTASRPFYLFWKRPSKVEKTLIELRLVLDSALSSKVQETLTRSDKKGMTAEGGQGTKFGASAETSNTSDRKEEFQRSKLEQLERHLEDYKSAIKSALPADDMTLYVLLDDFYLIKRSVQPDVVDYLHGLLRDTNAYLKLSTIRHRTVLRRHEDQTIGVELGQDVEEISLDKTFQSYDETRFFLVSMLDQLGLKAGIPNVSGSLFNPDAAHALAFSSGGVPRDFLNIFADAVDLSVSKHKIDRLTPSYIYKAAAQISLQNKRKNLAEDAGVDAQTLEAVFADLLSFCLKEKKKTCFLVSRDEAHSMAAENELLQQLMDFKLIHLVEPDTSAASGRTGRFSAYTLDAALFMEPRLRGIDIVAFWEQDAQRRSVGVREAPTYQLSRIQLALNGDKQAVPSPTLDDVLTEMSNLEEQTNGE